MPDKWLPIAEAAEILRISERTLRRRITKGEYESKIEDRRRVVSLNNGQLAEQTLTDAHVIHQQREEIAYLRQRVAELQTQLANSSERHDTIVLQLSRENTVLLEDKRQPWYRRWFRGTKRV